MIVKSLKLRGFKGIRAGMGIDELFIDLSVLPPGLIAICGANGVGKTTVLDNLHGYRLQPFKIRKAKDWSPAAFSYYDQCYGSDACKELCFSMGGFDYRSLVLIDSDKRRQECYLYRLESDQWVPMNDGKSKEYDRVINEVCGSPSLYFTSVFRCQNSRNLSDYSRSDIMSIISELLNIDHIREQSEKCRYVVNGLTSGLTSLRDRAAALTAEVDVAAGIQESLVICEGGIATNRTILGSHQQSLEGLRTEAQSIHSREAAQQSEAARLSLFKSQYAEETERYNKASLAASNAIVGFDRRSNEAGIAHQKASADLNERIARAEKIVSGAEAIRAAVEKESALQLSVSSAKVLLPSLQAARDGAMTECSTSNTEIARVTGRLEACRKDAAKLDGLDCHGDGSGWLNPSCRFISDAVVSRDTLESLELGLQTLHEVDIAGREVLKAADIDLAECKTSIASAEKELTECQRFTRLLPELELAEANLDLWRGELTELNRKYSDSLIVISDEKWVAESEWDLERMKMEGRIRDLRTEIEAFPVGEDLSNALRDLSIREAGTLSAIAGYEKAIRDAELNMASLRTKLEASQAKSGELAELKAKEGRYTAEIAKFSLLQRACSNSGIIALEVDDSGCGISSIANDLLSSCYGSRFSVRFDTQQQKLDGDMKDTFDIICYDSELDESRSLTELSGGQTSWINDALARAICLFNINSSGKTYGTLFVDEVDGALDASKKQEFFQIKRKAMELGTHSQEYFISQSPELIEMADARIVLSAGGVSIQ